MSLIDRRHFNKTVPKTAMTLTALNDRQRAILAALVYGLEGKAAEKHGLESDRPLTTIEAAAYFKARRRYVRDLVEQPLFKAEMTKAIADKRFAYAPEAIDCIAEAMRSADHNISLKAAIAMLGDNAKAPVVNVSVATQNNVAIKPGYLIRIPKDDP
jgi:hypothetical protein